MKALVLTAGILFVVSSLQAQLQSSKERKLVREGNKMYQSGKYSDAETQYRKGLEESKSSVTSTFNLGDALYKQGKYSEAESQFQNLSSQKIDKKTMAEVYHNLGNTCMKAEKYQESVDAYKKSLLNNPDDNETRYNLAYAMSKLQQQKQQQQQNQDKKNQDKKDKQQNKDQQNKDQQKKDQQKQQQDQQQNKEDKQQEKKQAQQQPKISKEDAERMLAALKNDEKDLQKRMQKKQAVRVGIEKNW